jgi:hypothetical protein
MTDNSNDREAVYKLLLLKAMKISKETVTRMETLYALYPSRDLKDAVSAFLRNSGPLTARNPTVPDTHELLAWLASALISPSSR